MHCRYLKVAGLAACVAAGLRAAPVDELASDRFLWRYEMSAAPNGQDLDGNGTQDWWDTAVVPVADGVASNTAQDQYFRDDFSLSIWRSGLADGNWTLETRVRAYSGLTNAARGTLGVMVEKPSDAGKGLRFNIATNRQDASNGDTLTTSLGTNDNAAAFHIFRIARQGAGSYWIWRDRVLLNTGGVALAGVNDGNNDSVLLGDFSTATLGGNYAIDYVRLTTNAYAPPLVSNGGGASNVTPTTATLTGELFEPAASPTVAKVFWGETDGGTVETNWTFSAELGEVTQGLLATNVAVLPGRRYYYRYFASNSLETAWAGPAEHFFSGEVSLSTIANAGEAGPVTGLVEVSHNGATNDPVTVSLTVLASSTAREGSDFAAIQQTVTIPAGQTNALVPVTPMPDSYLLEGVETVALAVLPGTYAVSATSTTIVEIADAPGAAAWPFAPTKIEGNLLWLDGRDLDGNGTNDVLASGTPVATWKDKSGHGYHATNPTAANQPVVRTNALAGGQAVEFDGTNDWLTAGTTGSFTNLHNGRGSTVFLVARTDVDPSAHKLQMFLDTGANTASLVGWGIGADDRAAAQTNGVYFAIQRGGGTPVSTLTNLSLNGSFPEDRWVVLDSRYQYGVDGADAVLGRDGTNFYAAESATAPSSAPAARALTIGAMGTSLYWLDGTIAEVLIFDHVLSSNQMKYVGTYLALKYRLPTSYDYPVLAIDNGIGPSEVAVGAATLNGDLFSMDGLSNTVSVFWGESDGGTDSNAWSAATLLGSRGVGALATNPALAADRQYYYRYHVSSAGGECWAPESRTFLTGALTLEATTPDAAEFPNTPGLLTLARPATATGGAFTVSLNTAASTASAGADYVAIPTTVTFPAGVASVPIPVTPIDDWILGEPPETVSASLVPGAFAPGSPSTGTVTIACRTAREMRRSEAFAYRYECNGAHLQNQDLDGDGGVDWSFNTTNRPSPWPGAPAGAVSCGVDVAEMSSTGIWRTASFSGDYTLVVGMRAIGDTNLTANKYMGSATIWSAPVGSDDTAILYVGTNSLYWGGLGTASHTNLSAAANDDIVHEYRIVRRKPAGAADATFWVWRDGELMNPGGLPLARGFTDTRQWVLLGDSSGGQFGTWSLDYIRLEKGSYAAQPFQGGVLMIR